VQVDLLFKYLIMQNGTQTMKIRKPGLEGKCYRDNYRLSHRLRWGIIAPDSQNSINLRYVTSLYFLPGYEPINKEHKPTPTGSVGC